jgi:hypothetical protein
MSDDKDWKLKLRYGKLTTPYKHYTAMVPVKINDYIEDLDAQPGTAWAGMKIWATDTDEVSDLVISIGKQTGFIITGNIEIYITEAIQPPEANPHAYNINFSYFEE